MNEKSSTREKAQARSANMSQVFAFIKARAQAFRSRAASKASAAGVSAAVVTAAAALVGAVGMAPANAAATASVSASIARSAQDAVSSAPCFKASFPDCSSSDPNVSFGSVSSGDTTGCEFQENIAWDDGTTNDYTFPGGPDGTQLATFTHQYSKPGTYTITATAQTTEGSCSSSGGSTLEFTLLGASSACSTATATYEADQKALEALQSASEDDAGIVRRDIAALTGAVDKIAPDPVELSIEKIKRIILNGLDPEASDINSDLADSFFQRAAALESAEAARAGAIIDIIDTKLIPVLGLPELFVASKDAGEIVTADAALKLDLIGAEAAQTAADAAYAAMENACQAGSAD